MAPSTEEKQFLDKILEEASQLDSPVMFILHKMQNEYRSIKEDHAEYIARSMGKPLSEIYSAATFYDEFKTSPTGKYVVKVCRGIVCHSRNSIQVLNAVRARLDIDDGETTKDGLFTLEEASCIGQCDGGPAMIINGTVFRDLDPDLAVSIIDRIIGSGGA